MPLVLFVVVCIETHAAGPFFRGLGDLPGGIIYSNANAVSADGTVVVGRSFGAGWEAFRWTQSTGIVSLGDLPGGDIYSQAHSVSADGAIVVGYSQHNNQADGEAFRWTESTGMIGLGDLSQTGPTIGSANAISANGEVVVGAAKSDFATPYQEAFHWSEAMGMVGLGDLPPNRPPGQSLPQNVRSTAFGVSADGSVIVGQGYSASGYEAFRWEGGNMVGLGDLAGGDFNSAATAVSADGNVVVGYAYSAEGDQAFRWTQETGMVGLGDLAGGTFSSRPQDVSGDGSVVVGYGHPADDTRTRGFIWDEVRGMRDVRDILVNDFGLSTSLDDGWGRLWSVDAISADGRTIVGQGERYADFYIWQEAFIARLVLPGDYDLDDDVDNDDFERWRSNFGSMVNLDADGNSDGIVDAADYVVWRANLGRSLASGNSVAFDGQNVPEPSSVAVSAVGLMSLLLFAGRNRLMRPSCRPA
jgi:probable HAF family extracellular repeat protein